MASLLSCEFNMDTVCVELKFVDGIFNTRNNKSRLMIKTIRI